MDRDAAPAEHEARTRDQPLVSVDVVALRRTADDTLEFALGARLNDPFIGALALPGVLLLSGERVHEATARALREKAELPPASVVVPFGVYDETMRDPRGATISLAHVAVVDPGVDGSATWVPAARLDERRSTLPFDHHAIVRGAFDAIATRLWADEPLTRALTGPTFSTREAVRLGADVGAVPPADPSNLRRFFVQHRHVERAEDQSGLAGRDTRWRWVDA